MIKTIITDATGTQKSVKVTAEHALVTADLRLPPDNTDVLVRPFRQYFTSNGLVNDGTNEDMRVDGSTTSVDFFIPASNDSDRYIDSINFVIADASSTLNKFGNIAVLTNGVEVFYEDAQLGTVILHDSLKSNFDFIRFCGKGAPMIGTGTNAFRASNVEGSSEGYIMTLDFTEQFGMPWGIRVPKDSTLRLVIRVKDDVTGVDAFNAIAYGFDRIIRE